MSRGLAFAVVTMMLVVFSVAASAPSPLYVVYQKEWGFTSTTLTVVFAVYVLGMLLSMLMVGGLSDHVGRRPVLFSGHRGGDRGDGTVHRRG
jgi:MFS family permease